MKSTLALLMSLGLGVVGCGGSSSGDGGAPSSSWLVGAGGALLSSPDGLFYTQHPAVTQSDLQSIFCVDHQHGWTAGSGGVLLRSDDSGRNWIAAKTNTARTLRAVAFADPLYGLAVGDNGTLLRSYDGGANWTAVASGTTVALRAVAVTKNRAAAWAVGDGGVLLRSTDSGVTFAPVAVGYDVGASFRAVKFAKDGKLGYLAGDAGLRVSKDGGASWSAVPQVSGKLIGLSVQADGSRVVAVGEGGLVWRSGDAGTTWTKVDAGTTLALNAIGFAEEHPEVGWAVGAHGTILRTLDAGQHFSPVRTDVAVDLSSVEDF